MDQGVAPRADTDHLQLPRSPPPEAFSLDDDDEEEAMGSTKTAGSIGPAHGATAPTATNTSGTAHGGPGAALPAASATTGPPATRPDGSSGSVPAGRAPAHHQQQQVQQQLDHQAAVPQLLQQQQQNQQPPASLAAVLVQLADNTASIAATEDVLRQLLHRQAGLHLSGRKLEQMQVLRALQDCHHQMGFSRGRPVAAVLLFRCLQHWGLLHQTEPCPFLEQLAALLQQNLESEDESAPAEVAGLQCRVANSLTLCAVLYCLLLKAAAPELAGAAAAGQGGTSQRQGAASAAEVVAAARRRVAATWQQGVAHVGPGLQALSKIKLGGWGFNKRGPSPAAAAAGPDHAAGAAGAPAATAATPAAAAAAAAGAGGSQHAEAAASHGAAGEAADRPGAGSEAEAAAAAAAAPPASSSGSFTSAHAADASSAGSFGSGGAPAAAATAAAAAVAAAHIAPPLEAFLLCCDQLVQQAYGQLRDQLKRRLSPLLADCVTPEGDDVIDRSTSPAAAGADAAGEGAAAAAAAVAAVAAAGSAQQGEIAVADPLSPTAAGAAVAGAAAASPAHAEAALMTYRSWSELVGVLHAALVALRAAHVPRALRAALMQQVLEFVNAQLFNQLLLRPECCSLANATFALRGLKQLDTWIVAEQSAGSAAAAAAGAHTHSSDADAGVREDAGGKQQQQQQDGAQAEQQHHQQQAAEAAVGSPGTGSIGADWEQVPADAGEFDAWQPPRQQQPPHWWRQQQQRQGRGRQQQQQQLEAAGGEQPELGPEAWAALSHIRQALQFLVFEHKGALSLEDLTEQFCPALSHQQLYRLCTTAWDEAPGAGGAGGVSGEVLEAMKAQHTLTSNGGLIITFLLDEPAGPPPFVQQQQPGAGGAPAAGLLHPHDSGAGAGGSSSGGGGRCRPGDVVGWDDGRHFGAGLAPLPAGLVDEGSPAEVWAFLGSDAAWPPGRH